jgi:hypothetical protein
MSNGLKFAGFLGRVFLVNTAAGVGAATGVVGTFVLATKVFRPQLKKAWDSIPTPEETK